MSGGSRRRAASAGGVPEPRDENDEAMLAQAVEVYDPQMVALMREQQEREEAETTMMKAVLGSVYSLKKPRDVVAGTSSGVKTVAKGIGLGLASLVAQPYLGAKHGGAKGFVKGVGGGVATCVGSSVVGVVVGSTQIVRGVVNTPSAMVNAARGKRWNTQARRWEQDWYSLPEEVAEVLGNASGAGAEEGTEARGSGGAAPSGSAEPKRPPKKVVDTTLYNVLEVPPEATEAEIRKAFYKKSLALHPDKNPDNPEATAQFQAVSEAYRVLGDEDRRRTYDEHGADSATAGMPKIEPAVFFAALFGSHHFEPFIGRLKLAQDVDGDLQSLLSDIFTANEETQPDILKVHRAHKRLKTVERERQVKLAVELAKRLDRVVGIPEAEREEALSKWEKEQAAEVARLAEAPCGPEMLYLIGWMYANRSRQFFAGTVLKRVMARVEGKVHLAQSKAELAGSIGKTSYKVNGIMKTAEKKKSLEAKAASAETKTTKDPKASTNAGNDGGAEDKASEASAPSTTASTTGGATASATETPAAPRQAEKATGGTGTKDGAQEEQAGATSSSSAPVGATTTGDRSAASRDGHEAQLHPGSLVMIRGLRGAPELNGEVGMVCDYDPEAQRYRVQILPDAGLKKLKRENLDVLDAPVFADETTSEQSTTMGGGSSSFPPNPSEDGTRTNYTEGDSQWAPGGDDAEMADAFKDCMPLFHDSLWRVTKLDVEFTLNAVVQKVLRDMSIEPSQRRQRAEALRRLGLLMQAPLQAVIERAREATKVAGSSAGTVSSPTSSSGAQGPAAALSPSPKKSSMLARLKPRTPWRSRNSDCRAQKAKAAEAKQRRMEAAIAMMAAGASTEDVDEMIAARAAMESEMEAGHNPFL